MLIICSELLVVQKQLFIEVRYRSSLKNGNITLTINHLLDLGFIQRQCQSLIGAFKNNM